MILFLKSLIKPTGYCKFSYEIQLLFVQSFMDMHYAGKFPGRLHVTFNITCAFPLGIFVHRHSMQTYGVWSCDTQVKLFYSGMLIKKANRVVHVMVRNKHSQYKEQDNEKNLHYFRTEDKKIEHISLTSI